MQCAKKSILGLIGLLSIFILWFCRKTDFARSSNGRTAGFGPVCGGSSPPRATKHSED